ncbi:MAG: OmpA family protein [Calditrichaeota bacterium]|nr:MAG: OmpA family protein [Calditrichota bacterium]
MKRTMFVLFLLITLASTVSAATWDQAKGIGLSISAVKPWAGNVDKAAMGSMFGINLKYGPNPYLLVGLDGGLGSYQPVEEGSTFKADSNSPFETMIYPINLTLRATPYADSRIKPYVIFGIGAFIWDLQNENAADKSVYGQQVDLSLSSGIGFEFFLTQSLGLDFLLRGLTLPTLKEDNVGNAYDVNRNVGEARFSLGYYFGQNRDKDKDGILDKVDAEPLNPEDFDGFQDADGAPEPDNDNDGILDANDKAPLQPEDKDGFQDEDGVPDLDNDNDGVLDVNDKAPLQAEDKDGFEDSDGVPDPDNDKDGILDVNDKCPNEAETKNGYMDEDGCPDKKPMPQLEAAGAKLVLQGVNFKTASAELLPESMEILDKVAEGLVDNAEVEIEIRGYTDNIGRVSSNQKLSEARANSVMQYLVSKGVAASRMTAAGYGPKDPVAPNDTPEGRAQNRRIEFYRSK